MTNLLLIAIALMGLVMLGSSRVAGLIRLVAAQGVMLAVLFFSARINDLRFNLVIMVMVTIVLKGWVMPWLLFRSLRAANVNREVDPYIGYTTSLVLGAIGVVIAFGLSGVLPLPQQPGSGLIVPVSLSTVFCGLLLLVSRKKAVTQVLGYLAMENGVLVFSLALGTELPTLVEMGILLDIFVAVFIMGITIYQISREFDNIDANNLSQLNDLSGNHRRQMSPHNGTLTRHVSGDR